MSQAELFWGAKFHQNEEKRIRGYILSQDSQFLRKYCQILKKN
jgi:hypothetical protein